MLLPFNDTLLVGQGPRLAGVDPLKGSVRWEVAIASPRGTNEVERLADLVGPLASRQAQRLRARVPGRGRLRRRRSAARCCGAAMSAAPKASAAMPTSSSAPTPAAASPHGAPAQRRHRMDVRALLHRGLSAPLMPDAAVVFGDIEGQVHFLARDSGEPQAAPADRRLAGGGGAGSDRRRHARGRHAFGRRVRAFACTQESR